MEKNMQLISQNNISHTEPLDLDDLQISLLLKYARFAALVEKANFKRELKKNMFIGSIVGGAVGLLFSFFLCYCV